MKANVSIQCFALPFDSPFEFAHETPAFVRKQPDYGAAGTNRTKTNQSSFDISGSEFRAVRKSEVRNAVRRKAEQILHRLALITDNQGTPKELLTIVPRPDSIDP